MAFAQINYSQRLGNGPYTIAEAGCFVTAFSNLLGRFGVNVDPPTLNNFFLQHNKYVHDPSEPAGTVDDVSWGTVSAYDGQVIVTSTGFGWPNSNDAIVEFRYKSPHTGQEVTHFCLVVNASTHTILDSYDAVTKVSPYGNPVAFATYERTGVVAVTPPPPAAAPAFTVEAIAERAEELKKDTHLYDLNQRSWPGLVNNPVGSGGAGTKFNTSAIAHHVLGGQYYLPDGSTTQGYNVVDCVVPAVPAAAAPPQAEPAPVPPKPAAAPSTIAVPYAGQGTPYPVKVTLKGFTTATQAGSQSGKSEDVPVGTYKVYRYYPGNQKLINISKTGTAGGWWINDDYNKITASTDWNPSPAPSVTTVSLPASSTAPAKPASLGLVTPTTKPVASTSPVTLADSFTAYAKPVKLVAVKDLRIDDLSSQMPEMNLPKYDPETNSPIVKAYGTVSWKGVEYYRLKTNNDPDFKYFYCAPKFDPVTGTPLLLALPQAPRNITTLGVARDSLELAKAALYNEVPKFLDDIIPKWFKNKK